MGHPRRSIRGQGRLPDAGAGGLCRFHVPRQRTADRPRTQGLSGFPRRPPGIGSRRFPRPQRECPEHPAHGIRLRHHRRRLGRLDSRPSPVRERQVFRGAARGRPVGHEEHPHSLPGRLLLHARGQEGELGLPHRGVAGLRRAQDPLPARARSRRLVVDQRPAASARHAGGLRRLGEARLRRLVLQGRAALLHEERDLQGRRPRLSRPPWPALGRGLREPPPDDARLGEGRPADGAAVLQGLQRPRSLRHRLLPGDQEGPPAPFDRARLPEPGQEAPEPQDRDRGLRDRAQGLGQSRDRRHLPQGQHGQGQARPRSDRPRGQARGAALRRLHQLAADAAAVGHR